MKSQTRERMTLAAKTRSPEGEQRRLMALRSPAARQRMSDAKKGKTPSNFAAMQEKAWAATRKDVLTYSGIHAWVRRNWGAAQRCEECSKQKADGFKIVWANKDHKYSRKRSDWLQLCCACHCKHDTEHQLVYFGFGSGTHCKNGHEYTPKNTRMGKRGRTCRQCSTDRFHATYVPRARKPKTHCIHGHEFTPENTFHSKKSRECKICRSARVRDWKRANKAKLK